MKLLLVSSDAAMAGLVAKMLSEQGHELVMSDDPAATWQMARGEVALVVFDLGEASPDRWRELARWRNTTELPMIALGPAGEGDDAVNALRLGADDYVRRPLHIAEFLARIEALVRRSEMAGQSYIADDGVYLERRSRQLVLEGRSVDLTPTEFKVLEVLIERKGQTISREELVKRVWGKDAALGNTNLSLYIWHLRQKVESNPARPRFIVTRWGVGYAFRTGDVSS